MPKKKGAGGEKGGGPRAANAARLDEARRLIEEGDFAAALERCERVIAAGAQGDDLLDASFLAGCCLLDAGEPRKALAAYDRGLALAPDDPSLLAARGEALFELWEFAQAEKALERALREAPDSADAHRYLALCLDRRGERGRAEKHFRRAHELDPEAWPLPVRVDRATFDRFARDAIESLPKWVHDRIGGEIGFLVDDYPALQILADRPDDADPQTLGLFFGIDVSRRYEDAPPGFVPNHILLFQRNLEQFAADEAELDDEVRTTIYHEVGHYLGYDEDGLEAIGLG